MIEECIKYMSYLYGKNSGTCFVYVAKVYSLKRNKVAVLPQMQIFNSLSGYINKFAVL